MYQDPDRTLWSRGRNLARRGPLHDETKGRFHMSQTECLAVIKKRKEELMMLLKFANDGNLPFRNEERESEIRGGIMELEEVQKRLGVFNND